MRKTRSRATAVRLMAALAVVGLSAAACSSSPSTSPTATSGATTSSQRTTSTISTTGATTTPTALTRRQLATAVADVAQIHCCDVAGPTRATRSALRDLGIQLRRLRPDALALPNGSDLVSAIDTAIAEQRLLVGDVASFHSTQRQLAACTLLADPAKRTTCTETQGTALQAVAKKATSDWTPRIFAAVVATNLALRG